MRLRAWIGGTEVYPLMAGSTITNRRPTSSAQLVIDDPDGDIDIDPLDEIQVEINNRIVYSEVLELAPWIAVEATAGIVLELDPVWGGFFAYGLRETTANAQHFIAQQGLSYVNNEDVVLSAYLKADGVNNCNLLILQRDHTTTQSVEVDLTDGSVTATGGATVGSESVGSGWYRVWVIGTTGTGSNDAQAYIQLENGATYVGTAADGIRVFGVQWQAGETTLAPYNRTYETSRVFDGFVNAVKMRRRGAAPARQIDLECVDWNWRLDNPPATITKAYIDATDQDIIIDAISEAGLSFDISATTSTVANIVSGINIAFDGVTPRQVLEEMSRASGGVYWVQDRTLRYNTEANATTSLWNIGPESGIGYQYDAQNLKRHRRHDRPLNSVEVVGPLGDNGKRPSATATDATSIAAIGTYHRKFEFKTVATTGYAQDIADQLVAAGKNPGDTVTFTLDDAGHRIPITNVNERIQIVNTTLGFPAVPAQYFVTRESKFTQLTDSISRFDVSAGPFLPSLTDTLRRIELLERSNTTTPTAIGALDFDAASSESVDSTSTSLTNIDNTGDFSIFATVKVDSIAATRTIAARDDGSNQGWTLTVTAAGLIQLIRTRATSNYTYSRQFPGGFEAGAVYRIVVTSDTTAGTRFWINGVEATTAGGSSVGSGAFHAAASSPFRVGRDNGGAYMDGTIGAVVFWSIALPETTATGVHNLKFGSLPFPQQIQLAWALDEFDEGTSATGTDSIIDRSANGYDGTPSNTPTGTRLVYIAS